METAAIVTNPSQDAALDAGLIIAELHQTEKIETVVVTGDFIELGTSYDTGHASSGNDGAAQLLGVVSVEQDDGAPIDSKVDNDCVRTNICDMFLAEGRVPTWPTLFDQILEEDGGIAFAGVCSSLQAALRLKELYEDETVTQYRAKSTVATFGRTEFQRTALRRATFRLMDVRLYTPIFILAKNRYVCHKGPDIDKGLKEKRKQANLGYGSFREDDSVLKGLKTKRRRISGDSELIHMSKRQRHCQPTKKVGCPATLTMYEVLIANCEDADFDDELSWKVRIATQQIELQRFIVVFLPRFHEGHEIGHSSASCVSRSWHPDVRGRLTGLLMDGIRDPDEMMALLKNYVETTLCTDYATKPSADDRRYYPLRTDIRNAIAYDLKEKKVPVKTEEDHLMELIQHWAEADPDDRVFFRPCSVGEVGGQQNLLLVYQSSNQHYLMQRYGSELIFIDETAIYSVPVIFVSVKTNCGFHPIAWFLLTSDSVESIAEGLAAVKNWNSDIKPKFVMCDPGNKHFEAAVATWPNSQPLLCDFCRELEWSQWMDKEDGTVQQSKLDILVHLRQIADAGSKQELDKARRSFVNDKVYTSSVPLQLFYTKQCLPVIKQWAQLYRQHLCTRIDATNVAERRGGLMQKHFQQSCTSNTVGIIQLASSLKETADAAWLEYWKSNVAQASSSENGSDVEESVIHLVNRPVSFRNHQLKAYHKARHFVQLCSDVSAYFQRPEDDQSAFLVRDFASAGDVWYRLELTTPSCSCSMFQKHKVPCQHFYAVFAVFDDVSWYSLPDWYRDHPFFSLDSRCLELEKDNGYCTVKDSGNNESASVRSINISRLTGLLDKIKASAGSVDDSSLSSCVQQIEVAATFVENAGRDLEESTGPVTSKTLQNELTLNCQRELQQQYMTTTAATHSCETDEAACADSRVWIQHGDLVLSQRHRAMLHEGKIDSTIITASLALLQAEDHDSQYSGLLPPQELASARFEGRHNENLVQVMAVATENSSRWICVSTIGCEPATVDIYDSTFPASQNEEDIYSRAVKIQVAALLTLPLDQESITLRSKPVVQSNDGTSSGLFAVAFAADLIHYQDIVGILDPKSLASHLETCLSSGHLMPFPKLDVSEGCCRLSPPFTTEVPICCQCRLPYSESRENDDDLMVMCCADSCQIQWYHLRCVGRTDAERQQVTENLWYCPWCCS